MSINKSNPTLLLQLDYKTKYLHNTIQMSVLQIVIGSRIQAAKDARKILRNLRSTTDTTFAERGCTVRIDSVEYNSIAKRDLDDVDVFINTDSRRALSERSSCPFHVEIDVDLIRIPVVTTTGKCVAVGQPCVGCRRKHYFCEQLNQHVNFLRYCGHDGISNLYRMSSELVQVGCVCANQK